MKNVEENERKTERLSICLSKNDIDYIKNKKQEFNFRSVSSFIRECVYYYVSSKQ